MAVQDSLMLHQMGVTSAFLNGTLSEDEYMKQPEKRDSLRRASMPIKAQYLWTQTIPKVLECYTKSAVETYGLYSVNQ